MNLINIYNLSIHYDHLEVINDFSTSFTYGVHLIKGANGCGKSSLLKSLAGIIPANENSIRILDFDLQKQALMAKQNICYVADKPEVYPFMTGMQFL